MPSVCDGPASSLFTPLVFAGDTIPLSQISNLEVSDEMVAAIEHAPSGACVCWGIPFEIGQVVAISTQPASVEFSPTKAKWLVFQHVSDIRPMEYRPDGFISPMRGREHIGEHAANYVMIYSDGSEATARIRRKFQLGTRDKCFESVFHYKLRPVERGRSQQQTLVENRRNTPWTNFLWAWENPFPDKIVVAIRFEPVSGVTIVSAISASNVGTLPLRWQTRQKASLTLPAGEIFISDLDDNGLLNQIQLDLGQVISATKRQTYPNDIWSKTYNNQVPGLAESEVIVEYTAHPDACFFLSNGQVIPVSEVAGTSAPLRVIAPATQRVTLKTVNQKNGLPTPVKLHLHGDSGEYLAPVDRHRVPNADWFEDYSVDFAHDAHYCTYIPGTTVVHLPIGPVYIEVSKGFEIRPVRKVVEVKPGLEEISVEIEQVLPWRERGWVTADTHVHFLSPHSALLEGSAEGVNVINLLASQWGELVTNVGDFDGKTTLGSRDSGGEGEYLVRVGTENRQTVLGHISLLGYEGNIIAPMTTGGPGESALGDPIEVLLTEWARQCKKQGGLVVVPHFSSWRAEDAAVIVNGDTDAIEMTSWGNLYGGISPYSLSDWYRYLNCGYFVAAVGGTDKMSANTAVGTVRTYARIRQDESFTYEAWMQAVRRGETFVTYGALLEFTVEGKPMGSRIKMASDGGTIQVEWEVASVTLPMSRLELMINGEVCESLAVTSENKSGFWSVKVEKSCWLALLVRGHYADKPEIILAHSSPVMIDVEGSPMLPAADAVAILDQIEGSMALLDTIGTRADDAACKRMRLILTASHRELHNRMHEQGHFHDHTPVTDHS